jgi:dihydroflavonol-4-reductase
MLALFLAGRSRFFLDCMLNVVDARDVAEGIILAAERGRSGERYILGSENIALREFLSLLESTSGRPMPRRSLPAPAALLIATAAEWIADHVTRREPPATLEGVRLALRSVPFDSHKARLELGYAPRPIQGALSEAVRWLCAMAPPQQGQTRSFGRVVAASLDRAGDE